MIVLIWNLQRQTRENEVNVTCNQAGEGSVATHQRSEDVDSPFIRAAIFRAQEGDTEALHLLYVRYSPDVFRFVKSLVRDHHEAEDITQNVFVKLKFVIGKYEPRDVPFVAWVLRVARNVALDHLRARRAVPVEEVRLRDQEHKRISHERSKDLRQALERLPGEQREVLMLRHIAGLSPVEIASTLGKTENSVHGLLHRGRVSMQASLRELGAAPVVSVSPSS
jgi:RNA polymerase sigma-70 factor (ECF subfamily)